MWFDAENNSGAHFVLRAAGCSPPTPSHQRASTSTATTASTPRDNSMELRPNNSISWLVCAAYHCATCIVVAADGSACCAKEAQRKKAAIAHLPHASIQQLNNSTCPCPSLFGQLTWPLEPAVLVCSPTAAARVASLHYRGGFAIAHLRPTLPRSIMSCASRVESQECAGLISESTSYGWAVVCAPRWGKFGESIIRNVLDYSKTVPFQYYR